VCDRPRAIILARSAASPRSIVAALVATSKSGLRIGQVELAVAAQDRHQDLQYRRQRFACRSAQDRPTRDQRDDDRGPRRRSPGPPILDHLQRQRIAQRRTRIVAVPPGQLDQLIEDRRLRGPIGTGYAFALVTAERSLIVKPSNAA
jgi:hypothetical protein